MPPRTPSHGRPPGRAESVEDRAPARAQATAPIHFVIAPDAPDFPRRFGSFDHPTAAYQLAVPDHGPRVRPAADTARRRLLAKLRRARDTIRSQAEQVRRANEWAEAADRARAEELAAIGDEVRAPLNAIAAAVGRVLDGKLTPEQHECLGGVGETAAALLGVVNDRLDLAKIEAGRFALDPADFDLRATLDDALRELAPRAHRKGLELACDMPAAVPAVLVGDPGRLRQVVVTLVGNAIRFTPAGEVIVRVRVEDQGPREARLHFSVTDTGVGIPADKLRTVFGRPALGLALAAHLVGLMGGSIRAESRVGAGTTVHFTARFGVPTFSDMSFSIPDLALVQQVAALVVEAHPAARAILADQLAALGLRPTAVADASAAWDELRRAAAADAPYPLVLAAGADGFDLAARVGRSGLAGAAVVLVSSADPGRDADRCRGAGAVPLRKPVARADLIEVLRQVLDPASISGTMRRPELPAGEETMAGGPQDTNDLLRTPAPVLDEDTVLARVGGSREVLRGLIEVFYQDCNTRMADLGAALAAGDGGRVRAAAHTVKGLVSFFGAAAAVDAATRLETAGDRDELVGAGRLFADLARELEAVSAALAPFSPAPPAGWHLGRADRSDADVFSPAGA